MTDTCRHCGRVVATGAHVGREECGVEWAKGHNAGHMARCMEQRALRAEKRAAAAEAQVAAVMGEIRSFEGARWSRPGREAEWTRYYCGRIRAALYMARRRAEDAERRGDGPQESNAGVLRAVRLAAAD